MELNDEELELLRTFLSEFVRPNLWNGKRWLANTEERNLSAKLGIELEA